MSAPRHSPRVHIISATRSPIGSMNGCLSSLTATELASQMIKAALDKVPALEVEDVDEFILGNVLSANLGQNPARQAALGGGLSYKTPCSVVNKVCSSGLKAIIVGVQAIMCGSVEVLIAGGSESSSNVPHYLSPWPPVGTFNTDSIVNGLSKDGLTDAYEKKEPLGVLADRCAQKHGFSRAQQDDFAIATYKRAILAEANGWFKNEISPVILSSKESPRIVTKDEGIQNLVIEKLKALPPAFSEDGSITAANASQLGDGAAMVILASETKVQELSLVPIASILGWAEASTFPSDFSFAPSIAIQKALHHTGMHIDEIDAFEINEAFSLTAMINTKVLRICETKVNVHGGSVALGHPLGASGARIVTTLLGVLRQTRQIYGCAAICNGGGEASALIVKLHL